MDGLLRELIVKLRMRRATAREGWVLPLQSKAAVVLQPYMPQMPTIQYQPQPNPQDQLQLSNMQCQTQTVPMPQPAPSASGSCIDFDAMRNDLLPGPYSEYIPKVIAFLEAWENVPKNRQPQWYQSALASYSITDRLKWIFEQDKPQEWIKPLPDLGMQVIFEQSSSTPHGMSTGANTLPNYMPAVQPSVSPQPTQNPQMLTIQSPPPTGEFRTQNWGSQQQGSSWYASTSQGSNADGSSWWKTKPTQSDQTSQGPSEYNQNMLNDGNFAKVSFTSGKLRRLLPRARDPRNAPDPEFEAKFHDEAMTHMYSHNGTDLPAWAQPVRYSTWLPPSLQLEKMSGLRNPMHVKFVDNEMLCALTYFMRNPRNWSVEMNTPTVILDNGKTEDRDLRRRSLQDWSGSRLFPHYAAGCAPCTSV
eukprot:1603902-Amphidinium_carterae.4